MPRGRVPRPFHKIVGETYPIVGEIVVRRAHTVERYEIDGTRYSSPPARGAAADHRRTGRGEGRVRRGGVAADGGSECQAAMVSRRRDDRGRDRGVARGLIIRLM